MKILQIFLTTLITQKCLSEFIPIFHTFNPLSAPSLPLCPHSKPQIQPFSLRPILDNTTALERHKDTLKFVLPFLDLEIQRDRNLHIIQEQQKQQIYLLHGHELFQLFVERQETRLSLMGVLEGSVRQMEPLVAKIINWQGNLIVVIALDEHLEVYQLAEDILLDRAENIKDPAKARKSPPVFEAIQQLTLSGKFQKLFLFSPSDERIMIVTAVNFTKLYGKLRIFEWFNTYFNPIEEITVPAMHMVNIIGLHPKYLVTGRAIKHQPKTILTVYEISPVMAKLTVKQTLTVESRVVHLFSYHHRNMIVACSSKQQKCSSFRQMPDGSFSVYRQRTPKEFAFDRLVSSKRFVAASRQNQIIVFTNHRLDCYGSFVSDEMDVTDLMGFQNAKKEIFLLVVYKRPFKTLMRLVELEINVKDLPIGNQTESEESQAAHHHLFEQAIGRLRSTLLQRKTDMDIFRKLPHFFKPKLKNFEIKERTTLHAGNVGIIKIVSESLSGPIQIIKKIESLRKSYLSQRSKRSENQSLFNDTLDVTNRLKVKRMKVKNLIYHADIVEGFSLNLTKSQNKILTITPKVSCRFLNTSELIFQQNIRETRQQTIPDLYFDLIPSIRVSELKVDFINGELWNTFYDSLFLKNRDKFIEGRLILQSPVKVEHLTAALLNGLVVSNLFNLKHPQIIRSILVISRFFANDLKAKTVNGLNFEEDIVFSGNDTFIETPVIINHLRISGELFLANNTKVERFAANRDEIEFQQFYTNKVSVNGSLVVNNLKRLNGETRVTLNGEEFNENDIKEKYLLKYQAQNFSFPVIFEEAKVTAPSLDSAFINHHPTEQHMLVNKMHPKNPLLLVFMNIQVNGNVIIRDYKSKIADIKENIIHPGSKVNIRGRKLFEAPLEINNLQVGTLNELTIEDLVFKTRLNKNSLIKFKDTKVFSKIKVKNPITVDKELNAAYLNNLPLENLLNNDYYLDRLKVDHLVETSNLVFHKINGVPFDKFFTKLNVKNDRLVLHKDLIVEGNVRFEETLNLEFINHLNWNEYVENLVRVNENTVIEGEVCFSEDLTVTNHFVVIEINGYDLEHILNNVLMKSHPQLVTGYYHFDYLRGSNLDVSIINNVNVTEFMDLSKKSTEVEADVVVENLNIEGNLQGHVKELEFLFHIKDKIQRLTLKPFRSLYVLNNALWPLTVADNEQHELLKYFYKSAVLKNREQIVTGNVRMFYPVITNMKTLFKFPSNLDLEFIQQDAVLRNSSLKQRVKGKKVFLRSLSMANLKAHKAVNTKFLDKIDVLRFNQSVYRVTSQELLKGPMQFLKTLSINQLTINGSINGLDTSGIYQLQPNMSLPVVQVQQLYVENDLIIKNVNYMNWAYFLDNRLTLKGPALEHFGHLIFENLVIEKQALIQSINGIPIANLVFKHSPYLQTVTGHKMVKHSLELAGPAHIMRINDNDIMELYRNSLLKNGNYDFSSLILEQAEFEQGLQMVSKLNYNLQQRSFDDSDEVSSLNELKFLKFLKEFQENLSNSKDSYKNILYLDYDFEILVQWLDLKDNITANHTIYHELSRISCCEKRYMEISLLEPSQIYLKNFSSLHLVHPSNKFLIKAENYCLNPKRKVKSKITLTGPKLLKIFGMKRYIETAYIVDNVANPLEKFVILHALDMPNLKRNEVRIFKISMENNSIHDLQGLTQNIGLKLKSFTLAQTHILITNGLVDHHPALTIYHFHNKTNLFKVQQVIDGDYDILEMLELPNKQAATQLIISCSKCQRIFIYEFVFSQKLTKYEIQQIITLKSPIDKLVIFNLNKTFYMLVISQPNYGFYYIYKFSYIQGWLPVTFGYFPYLQLSVPLTGLWNKHNSLMHSKFTDSIPLVLLCKPNNCYVVKAVV